MKNHSSMRILAISLSLAIASAAIPMAMAGQMDASTQKTVMVGGAEMSPAKNIVENASNSSDHTTLVAAVKAADLVDTLQSAGPFTVFAPTNGAFAALPAGTVDDLLKPENKATLTKILTYHVVSGKYMATDLAKLAKSEGGKATLTTVAGESITVADTGGKWTVTDAKGNVANITIADVAQSNGAIFVIDKVLMP